MEEEILTTSADTIKIVSESVDGFYNVAMWVVGIVGFLIAVALFYLIIILRDASYISQKAKETSETVNEYIKKPAGMILRAFNSVEGLGEIVMGQVNKFSKKKRRSKKSDD